MSTIFGKRTLLLSAADIVILYIGILLSLYVRLDISGLEEQIAQHAGLQKIAIATGICTISLYLHDLYDFKALNDRRELVLRLIQALGTAWIVLAIIFYFFPSMLLGRGIALIAVGMSLFLLLTFRIAIHYVSGHPLVGEQILVVGNTDVISETLGAVENRRDAGYRIIGYLTDDPGIVESKLPLEVPALGSINNLEQVVASRRVQRVVIGVRERRGAFPADTLLKLRLADSVAIEESTSFFERVSGKIHLDNLRPSWLIFSIHSQRSRINDAFRGVLQQAIALIGLVVSLPVSLLTILLIKLESKGGCFYKQERVGRNGKPFIIYKFRSMRVDAETDGEAIWAAENDPRITAVGRVIRKLRIDEIPQFWNILKGEMNFIGPRPERPHFVAELSSKLPFYECRHLVAPGLTGWAQVNYPYGASIDDAREKLQYDLFYIKNQSLILDVLIMIETLKTIIFGRGAR